MSRFLWYQWYYLHWSRDALSPICWILKSQIRNIFLCAQTFEQNMYFYIVFTMLWFTCLGQNLNIQPKLNKLPDKLEKRMLCQIWQFQFRNSLKLSHKKKRNVNCSTTIFSKTKYFILFLTCLCALKRPSTKTKIVA